MAYRVKTEKFEGPFDALLNLIEEKKLSISEISLSGVCEDFLVYLKTLGEISRREAASFLAVGATLMLIKSRALIPSLELTSEEEESIEELENRLKLLKIFKGLAGRLQERARANTGLFSREAFSGYEFGFLPPEKITPAILSSMLAGILDALPKPDLLPKRALAKVITIEEKTRELINRIQNHLSGPLEKVILAKDKIELILGVLAMEQKNIFGEVELKRLGT